MNGKVYVAKCCIESGELPKVTRNHMHCKSGYLVEKVQYGDIVIMENY